MIFLGLSDTIQASRRLVIYVLLILLKVFIKKVLLMVVVTAVSMLFVCFVIKQTIVKIPTIMDSVYLITAKFAGLQVGE